MSDSFEINEVTRFAVDAIGEPGHRVFLLQIEGEEQLRTLKTEKQSVASLAESITELLEDITGFGHLPDDLDLTAPLDVAWNTGAMSVAWDPISERFHIEIGSSLWETGNLPDGEDSLASIRITKEQAAAFAIKVRLLVESGRPPCPLCGYPLEPDGHACPRTNGYRPPTL